MIIVDRALEARARNGNPIRLAMVGAGFSGRHIAHQITTAVPGIRLVAIANRTVAHAQAAFGTPVVRRFGAAHEFERAIEEQVPAVTDDPSLLWESPAVDVILENTGTIEHGAWVALESVRHGKHVVLVNVELDATLGPILKHHADAHGVIITNTDGDEPGVAMNLIRYVRSIGLEPVVAGNLKGFYDRYRTPETQREFARRNGQKATSVTSFADGTKLSMELTVLANAAGFGVARRGAFGPALEHVSAAPEYYRERLRDGGMVDFLCGAYPANGAFVLGHTEDPMRAEYLRYLKMGEGPLYVFHTPFHLPQLEVGNTIARAVLLGDAAATPIGAPICDAVAVAKRDLKAGEPLDGLGGFTCYALVENHATVRAADLLPAGLAGDCVLRRDVARDHALTYSDVEVPAGRLCDRLRAEQDRVFAVPAPAVADAC